MVQKGTITTPYKINRFNKILAKTLNKIKEIIKKLCFMLNRIRIR